MSTENTCITLFPYEYTLVYYNNILGAEFSYYTQKTLYF